MAHLMSLRDRQVGRWPHTLPRDLANGTAQQLTEPRPEIASIQKLLNLNHDPKPADDIAHDPATHNGLIPQSTPILNEDGDPIWKVLVFDGMGRDVISSVLRVNDLRTWGVTIHLYNLLPRMLANYA